MFPYSCTFLAFQWAHCACDTYLGLCLVMALSVNLFHAAYLSTHWSCRGSGALPFAALAERKGEVSCLLSFNIWPLRSPVTSHKLELGHVSQCPFKVQLPSTGVITDNARKHKAVAECWLIRGILQKWTIPFSVMTIVLASSLLTDPFSN